MRSSLEVIEVKVIVCEGYCNLPKNKNKIKKIHALKHPLTFGPSEKPCAGQLH